MDSAESIRRAIPALEGINEACRSMGLDDENSAHLMSVTSGLSSLYDRGMADAVSSGLGEFGDIVSPLTLGKTIHELEVDGE